MFLNGTNDMYVNVITRKENASEDWDCITCMFLTSFSII